MYFDHKRQTDPEFRKSLKRNNRRVAKVEKEEAEAHGAQQREAIKAAVQRAKEEGFPVDLEEKESYFMSQVAKGEGLCAEGMYKRGTRMMTSETTGCIGAKLEDQPETDQVELGSEQIEAAIAFYKALKVYPQPKDLISIYDKTVPKEVLEILAEMVAMDPALKLGSFTGESAGAGADNVE